MNRQLAEIPVSRARALERTLFRVSPGVLILFATVRVIGGLNFTPNAFTNRITEYSLVILMLPVGVAGVILTLSGLRWLLTAAWPGRLRIIADPKAVTFHLGPMGVRRYGTDRLTLNYLFETSLDDDDEDAVYESLLSPSEQIADLLPRMQHSDEPQRLDRCILYFTRLDQKQAADALRPFVEYIRRDRPLPDDPDGQE